MYVYYGSPRYRRPSDPAASLPAMLPAASAHVTVRPRGDRLPSHASMRAIARPGLMVKRGKMWVPCRGVGALTGGAATAASIASTGASITASLVAMSIPIAGPIAAGIILVGNLIANAFSGCGQTCVAATNIANQVEGYLKQNLDTYLSAPVHYASLQAAALNNFDTAWAALQQGCSNPQLGDAGKRCISDRQSGACIWKASPGQWNGTTWVPWGAVNSGSGCFNWFSGYRDPIANDPTVVPDPSPGASTSAGLLSSVGINPATTVAGVPLSDLILPAALIALALLL